MSAGESTALERVVEAADPAIARHAVERPGPGRFESELSGERAVVVESVLEAYLMHYGEPRAFARVDDDFRLLGGDALYALGLSRLAERGDLTAVAELADLISLCALVHAERRPGMAEELWRASARTLSAAGGPGARAAYAAL